MGYTTIHHHEKNEVNADSLLLTKPAQSYSNYPQGEFSKISCIPVTFFPLINKIRIHFQLHLSLIGLI